LPIKAHKDICPKDVAQKDICPERHLPRKTLAQPTFALKDICPEGYLPRKTFAQKDNCPERQLPRGTFAQKDNCPDDICSEIQWTILLKTISVKSEKYKVLRETMDHIIIEQKYSYQKYNLPCEKFHCNNYLEHIQMLISVHLKEISAHGYYLWFVNLATLRAPPRTQQQEAAIKIYKQIEGWWDLVGFWRLEVFFRLRRTIIFIYGKLRAHLQT
jgi:hypothetical protein